MGVIIYHNPRCSKSREALQILNEQGCDLSIVEYMHKTPGFFELKHILKYLGYTPRQLMRTSEQVYKDLNIESSDLTDDQLVKLMVKYPMLIQRPIVVNGQKAVIGRPPEKILNIL